MRSKQKRNPVGAAIGAATVNAASLAESAGLSYAALASWRTGRRTPTPEAVARLADAIEGHADRLREIVAQLREAA